MSVPYRSFYISQLLVILSIKFHFIYSRAESPECSKFCYGKTTAVQALFANIRYRFTKKDIHLREQSSSLQDTVCEASPLQSALFPELQRLVLLEDPRPHEELQADQIVHALHSITHTYCSTLAYSWGRRRGSCSSWSLQASRSSAAKDRCSGGMPRQDQPRSSTQSRHRVLARSLGLRPIDVEKKNFWLFFLGHSFHMSIPTQL